MTSAQEEQWIVEAIRQTYHDAELPYPPEPTGPVALHRLIGGSGLTHEEVPGLNRAAASAYLRRWGVRWAEVSDPDPKLAGFLYANADGGYLFVRREDNLPRRRFTAAHELGHFRLHLGPALAQGGDAGAGLVEADADVTESTAATLSDMERQANRFAAEVLMPEGVCRALFERYARQYGPVPRFLTYHLASALLVSREAIAWRLFTLGLIDKPARPAQDKVDEATGSPT